MIFLGLILLRWKDETRKECRYPIQYTPLSLSYTLTHFGSLRKTIYPFKPECEQSDIRVVKLKWILNHKILKNVFIIAIWGERLNGDGDRPRGGPYFT